MVTAVPGVPISYTIATVAALLLLLCAYRRALTYARHGFAIPVLIATIVLFGWLGYRKHHVEQAATSAVQELLGTKDVKVICRAWQNTILDSPIYGGWVRFNADGTPDTTAVLSRDTCNALRAWLNSDKNDPPRTRIAALGTLAHEAGHLGPTGSNEAATECWGLQQIAPLAEHLGATPSQARYVASRYWTDVHPYLPGRYLSGECRPGRSLDLTPGDDTWP